MSLHDLAYWQAKAKSLSLPHQSYVGGRYVGAADGGTMPVVNPATGQLLVNVSACQSADVDVAVQTARDAFDSGAWSGLHPRDRKLVLLKLASLIEAHTEELALLETLSMGKPIADAILYDLPESAKCFSWYGEAIDKQYDEIAPTGNDALATITREPVGVVAAVVPWNYPLMMASWKVAPALAAGNSVVLKPAEQSPLSVLKLAELALQAGIPPGVFNVVPGRGSEAGQSLGLHPQVDCLAFTGSTATGKRFMQYSGQSNLKRVWLECGGKSPHIIFDDCPDLDAAAQAAAIGIFANQGEVCIAGSRLYVHDSIYDVFMEKVALAASNMQPGDPLDPTTVMGAIVDERQYKKVLDYIVAGQEQGAKLRLGGQTLKTESGGYFISPTIFDCSQLGVTQADLSIVNEEIFGPVLAVQRFSSEDEVIRLANDSIYGLGAGLWTANLSRAHRVSRKLRAGLVWVNCYFDGDITVPFGGVKQSGFGRDKSLHALDKYCDLKTTWFNLKL